MSTILADVDATCASLGYFDGNKYVADFNALQGLKVSQHVLQLSILSIIFQFSASYMGITA